MLETFSLCAGLLILTGLDLKISAMRWAQGSRELNPLVAHALTHGKTIGLLTLAATNVLLISLALLWIPAALILLGAKMALATIQLRSLYEHSNSRLTPVRK